MTDVLALTGGMLRIAVERATAGDWFDVRLDVSAPPFSGTVESAWFDEEMASLRDALAVLAGGVSQERTFELDGHRGATLRLTAEPAVGGGVTAPGELALRVWLTPSGDDPSVVLQFDTFEPPETFARGLERLETLLA